MGKGLKPQFEDIDLPVAKPGGAGPLDEGRGPASTPEPIDQGAFRTLSTTSPDFSQRGSEVAGRRWSWRASAC